MKDTSFVGKDPLERAIQLGNEFLNDLDTSEVGVSKSYDELKALWDWQLPLEPKAPELVIEEINQAARPGLMHNQSGRFFAWVIGGAHPAALGVDILTSIWDQNAGIYATAPSSSIAEEISGQWLKELLNIPAKASFAFVTGGQMANFTCLMAARNYLFNQAGWDIETRGFYDAPRIRIISGDQKHSTIDRALRMLGFGTEMDISIPSDDMGRISVKDLETELKKNPDIPTLLAVQAGEIHTGAFDDFESLIPLAHQYGCWVHIDGAFGLWAAASKTHAHHLLGSEKADSWAVDGHKWLNVPYDSGYAFVAHPDAHFLSLSHHAAYIREDEKARDQFNWNAELSRRARGFSTYAAIKELGASGIEDLVDRCCRHATAIVEGMTNLDQVEILAKPQLNQGLVRFKYPDAHADEVMHDQFTEEVIKTINASGEAFFQPSTFKGKRCMRISVSGWRTRDEDVKRTLIAITNALKKVNSWIA